MLEFVLLGNAKYAIGDHCQRVQPLEFRGGQKIDYHCFYLKSASTNDITTFRSVTLTIIRLGEIQMK